MEHLADIENVNTVVIDLTENVQQDDGYRLDMEAMKSNSAPVEAAPLVKDTVHATFNNDITRSSANTSVVNSHASPSPVHNHNSSGSEDPMAGEEADNGTRTPTDPSSSLSSKSTSFRV